MEKEFTLNQKKMTSLSKDARDIFEEMFYDDLCLLLAEILDVDWKSLRKRYNSVGYRALFGAIIAEIKFRKSQGDKLRSRICDLEREISGFRQLELFATTKKKHS